jgi:protein-tyrosine phosphatase
LCIEGTRNLRDIGGYPTLEGRQTRWGTVLRSDSLDRLTPTGQARLRRLRVRTVIDLRSWSERCARPDTLSHSPHIRYRWLPVWDDAWIKDNPPDFDNGFIRELDECGERLAAIFRELLLPEALPAIVHCTAGKDRTGLVVALLLSVAGVARQIIVSDYALSSVCLGQPYVEDGRHWLADHHLAWNTYAYLYAAPPERMARTLESLDLRWRGAAGYLRWIGLTPCDVEQLRARLTTQRVNHPLGWCVARQIGRCWQRIRRSIPHA